MVRPGRSESSTGRGGQGGLHKAEGNMRYCGAGTFLESSRNHTHTQVGRKASTGDRDSSNMGREKCCGGGSEEMGTLQSLRHARASPHPSGGRKRFWQRNLFARVRSASGLVAGLEFRGGRRAPSPCRA